MIIGKNPHGGNPQVELDFSVNLNPFGPPKECEKIWANLWQGLAYYPDPYCTDLTQEVKQKEQTEKTLLFGNGAAELIYAFAASLRGKKVLVFEPTFSEYAEAAKAYGCEIRRVLCTNEFLWENPWTAADTGVDAIFLCSPNNPTGRLLPKETLFRLAEACEQKGIFLFLDFCFLDFVPNAPYLAKDFDAFTHVVCLRAFTKNYALAGARLGYLICEKTVATSLNAFLQAWNVSVVAQKLGVCALKDAEYLPKTAEFVRVERERVQTELKKLGVKTFPSDANFFLFRARPDLNEQLQAYGMCVRDCSNFYGLADADGMRYFRMGLKTTTENQRLLGALEKILK